MSLKVTITIPSTQKNGQPVQNRATYLDGAVRSMCGAFGGCTATDGTGSWVDDNGKTVSETVTVLTSYVDTDKVSRDEADGIMDNLAHWVKDRLNQYCVLVTVEYVNSARFI